MRLGDNLFESAGGKPGSSEAYVGELKADPILTERHGQHVLVITINRFHRRNSFDAATARAMEEAMDLYEQNSELRVAVITGQGGVFCAGKDLLDPGRASSSRRGGLGMINQRPEKPLIAAVEGYAVAGGLELCLACDLIVASRTARMGIPEAAKALVALGGGLTRLPKQLPYHLAMELALTGESWSATEFHRVGLVNHLTEPGLALSRAIELAEKIAANAPLAVKASLQVVRRAMDWSDAEGLEEQQSFLQPVFSSEDKLEGLRAFAEKRAPVWKGR